MGVYATRADRDAIQTEVPWGERDLPATVHECLTRTRDRAPDQPAVTFQLTSAAGDRGKTLTWADLHARVTQAANLFRSLGTGPGDTVAFVLPNSLETVAVLLAGMVAGVVLPINPMLAPAQIAAILTGAGARVVVTLRAFPETDLAARVAEAVAQASGVAHVVEVDLAHYLRAPKRWIVPALRPRHVVAHRAKVVDFATACARQPSDRLTFTDERTDRIGALFHTGGTTGAPKVARHRISGMIYNSWLGARLLFTAKDVILCPLPLFHVFAVYPILMSCVSSGAQVVLPTPAGYRGKGVFDALWTIIAQRRVTYLITVPTALAALMQRPVNADIASLRGAFSGSAPLPVDLFTRFEAATGVQIIEGYGLTEATCLVAVNPPEGVKKVGSVGLPFPYTEVRIIDAQDEKRECDIDEVGEICISSPGVCEGHQLRTGDLGRLDADGYLWITGRKKDLIIRGGHNIDPAVIEQALAGHEAVAVVGAIGQPDAFAGELPCAYVELVKGAQVSEADLMAFARARICEPAAVPKWIEVLDELPKTAVGKVFKPDLRRRAITRVLDAALAGTGARVVEVAEDRSRGLIARIGAAEGTAGGADLNRTRATAALAPFVTPWDWA